MDHLRILIVDDDPACRLALGRAVDAMGCTHSSAEHGIEAFERLDREPVDVLISDWQMPGLDGLQLFRRVRDRSESHSTHNYTYCILVTGASRHPSIIEAIEGGADDLIEKPVIPSALRERLLVARRIVAGSKPRSRRHASSPRSHRMPPALLGAAAGEHAIPTIEGMVGECLAMREFLRMLRLCARADTTVLLQGESGTGKELAARAAHRWSPHRDGPFIVQNCGAIPDELGESEFFGHRRGAFTGATDPHRGLFEQAHGGTLFLDEIGDLSPNLQVKLLRVLEDGMIRPLGSERDRHVDVRLVVATHRDLQDEVRAGRFRQDLYFRLAMFPIDLPPLRDRGSDIELLIEHFLAEYRERTRFATTISDEVHRRFVEHDWPGNVRELKHSLERSAVLAHGGRIELEHLPACLRSGSVTRVAPWDSIGAASSTSGTRSTPPTPSQGEMIAERFRAPISKEERERAETVAALQRAEGNRSHAARLLGMSRGGLWKRMKRLGLVE